MNNPHRKLVSYLLAFALALGSLSVTMTASASETYVFDTKPTAGHIMLDLFVMRPLMAVGSVVGAATLFVGFPFLALAGNVEDSAETLLIEPLRYTFLRPLGEI